MRDSPRLMIGSLMIKQSINAPKHTKQISNIVEKPNFNARFKILDKSNKSELKRRKLNSFQENIISLTSDSEDSEDSPENLKMSSDKHER